MGRITLRHLIFRGPNKTPASLQFSPGLNILYGASETGKSFVLEAINFMLGGSAPLRDIPESREYDQILLGFEVSNDQDYTLLRSTQGGDFKLFEGLHEHVPENLEGKVLNQKHNSKNDANVSRFLLKAVGLDDRSVKKNASTNRSLSFRDIAHLIIVSEEEIHKQGSPIETGQHLLRTPEFSTFKLLLSGIDDGALIKQDTIAMEQATSSKTSFIDELLAELRLNLKAEDEQQNELEEQLKRLEESIEEQKQNLTSAEAEYAINFDARIAAQKKLSQAQSRKEEINELLARFALLNEHYTSDLSRLEAMSEAGGLMDALPVTLCPLCGAAPDHQHPEKGTDADLTSLTEAAISEAAKIRLLRNELKQTVEQLTSEGSVFEKFIPEQLLLLKSAQSKLDSISEALLKTREDYSRLVDEKLETQSALVIWNQIESLNKKRELLASTSSQTLTNADKGSYTSNVSSTILDEFAKKIEGILKQWEFPDADRVHFDTTSKDLVISGKQRGSRGKGMRSITHAAFTVGLLEFSVERNTGHPGFVVIDSPLLAYREPENNDDDLRGTAVQSRFYSYLSAWEDKQIIVIENVTPPETIRERPTTLFFSKNVDTDGRYGFFPI